MFCSSFKCLIVSITFLVFCVTVSADDTAANASKNPATVSVPDKLADAGSEKPTITQIPGGLHISWPSLTNVGAIEVSKELSGKFEVAFDVSPEGATKKPEPVSDPAVIVPLADYWIVRGKPERAIPLYRIGLEKKPDNLLFQNNLAMLLSYAGKNDEALEVVNKALAQKDDNVTLLDSKGLILMNAGRSGDAVPVLERAVELSCQLPMYCMHLASALDKDGRESGAKRYLDQVKGELEKQASKMSPDNRAMYDSLLKKYAAPAAQ